MNLSTVLVNDIIGYIESKAGSFATLGREKQGKHFFLG